MARKDEILISFLTHALIEGKYEIKKEDLPSSIREALISDKPIIKAIALIVEGLESSSPIIDSALQKQVTQYLNESL
jgi:hypothetical protein